MISRKVWKDIIRKQDVPEEMEEKGQCITFYTNKDLQKLEKFMQGKPVAEQEIGKQLLLETAAYAESSVCRRKLPGLHADAPALR